MKMVWVVINDGTTQCDERNQGFSLDHTKALLEQLGAKVINSEKRQDCSAIARVCGERTGRLNAHEISEEDWEKVRDGFVGPNGFWRWECDEKEKLNFLRGSEIPWPLESVLRKNSSVRSVPVSIRDLIGRPVRCYEEGDVITKDFIPERVNIEMEKDTNTIKDVWFG